MVTWLIGVALTIGCAAWYVWPLGDENDMSLPTTGDALTDRTPTASDSRESLFDRSAYAAVNLWNPPTSPEVAVDKPVDKPKRREIPLRLKLVAIITPTPALGAAEAAIYDPDTDGVLIVGEGDRINDHFSVKQINPTTVELFDGRDIRVLELEDKPK